MRFVALLLLSSMLSLPVMAQTSAECEAKIAQAETTQDVMVYDECGFNNVETAWNTWAGWVSQKEYKKALYQLCVRWPHHMYSDLYCEKSADLGYAPAIAEQGHRLMAKGLGKPAEEHYARALQIGGLSDVQEGQVAERLGFYYLDEMGGAYAPAKAVEFLAEASKKRSAAANNMIGYLFYTGEYGQPQKDTKAFEYFWRAILLGCPAAEENLGLFHLVRGNQLKRETAVKYMRSLAFSCAGTSSEGAEVLVKPAGCNCEMAQDIVERHKNKPYYLIDIIGDEVRLQDHNGKVVSAHAGKRLPDDFVVAEVRKTAIILEKAEQRVVLNLVPDMDCIEYCKKMTLSDGTVEDVKIKPYRLTFTPSECRDLLYYAPALVDVKLPFVGKKECAGSGAAGEDVLLKLMRQDNEVLPISKPVSIPKYNVRPFNPGVKGQIGVPTTSNEKQNGGQSAQTVRGKMSEKTVKGKRTPSAQSKTKRQSVRPQKKQIRFTVGAGAGQTEQ
ncbi:MAG: sel1 repeat family protein [Alphaproteobacteria bacterium]|nr:sel1 repeat family protein [Alphaproteobacteria bacterium]